MTCIRIVDQATLRVTNVHDPIAAAVTVTDPSQDSADPTLANPSVTTTPSSPPIEFLDVNVIVDISVLPALCTPPATLPPLKGMFLFLFETT